MVQWMDASVHSQQGVRRNQSTPDTVKGLVTQCDNASILYREIADSHLQKKTNAVHDSEELQTY